MIDTLDRKPIQRALLIDDEVFDQKMYRRIIQRSGLVEEIIGFQAADHALEYLGSDLGKDVDVIFLDINMPRMNGFEFLERAGKELGAQLDEVFIVMLTTSLNPSDRAQAAEFDGVRDFLNKPLTVEDVLNVAVQLHEAGDHLPLNVLPVPAQVVPRAPLGPAASV